MSVLVDYLHAEISLMLVCRDWLFWCREVPFTIVDPENIDIIPSRWSVTFKQEYKQCSYRIGELIKRGYGVRIECGEIVEDMNLLSQLEIAFSLKGGNYRTSAEFTNKRIDISSHDSINSINIVLDKSTINSEELVFRGAHIEMYSCNVNAGKIIIVDGQHHRNYLLGVRERDNNINCDELYVFSIRGDVKIKITCRTLYMYRKGDRRIKAGRIKASYAVYFDDDGFKDIYRTAGDGWEKCEHMPNMKSHKFLLNYMNILNSAPKNEVNKKIICA